MQSSRRALILGVAAVLTLSSAAALSFPKIRYWHQAANGVAAGSLSPNPSPNGRAIYYTGGARDYGLTCAHCHIKGSNQQGLIGITVSPSPAFANVNNQKGYTPGATYNFTVTMTGEHLFGPNANDNGNGMNLTIEDAGGNVKGVFVTDQVAPTPNSSSANCQPAPAPPASQAEPLNGTTWVYGDCHGVLFSSINNNVVWKFKWTAPPAGAGPLTIYYGAVDGDHKEQDCVNDDVVVGTVKLVEGP